MEIDASDSGSGAAAGTDRRVAPFSTFPCMDAAAAIWMLRSDAAKSGSVIESAASSTSKRDVILQILGWLRMPQLITTCTSMAMHSSTCVHVGAHMRTHMYIQYMHGCHAAVLIMLAYGDAVH